MRTSRLRSLTRMTSICRRKPSTARLSQRRTRPSAHTQGTLSSRSQRCPFRATVVVSLQSSTPSQHTAPLRFTGRHRMSTGRVVGRSIRRAPRKGGSSRASRWCASRTVAQPRGCSGLVLAEQRTRDCEVSPIHLAGHALCHCADLVQCTAVPVVNIAAHTATASDVVPMLVLCLFIDGISMGSPFHSLSPVAVSCVSATVPWLRVSHLPPRLNQYSH
mmetsp:Transcript_16766/g.43533  ORF Transcript_16766/g.43533 Transcript_16766/m.43533 type:complete len:218 (+) Transcript_16766:370-1023(+)